MPPYSEDGRHTVAKHIRFPQKLWLLVNAGDNEIMTWCRNGASIYVDLSALDTYLQSGESLFRTRHLYTFLRQLNQYGFQKISRHRQLSAAADGGTESSFIQEYTSEFFKRNRPFLLNNLVRRTNGTARRVIVPKKLMRRRCRPGVDVCERIDCKPVNGLRRARCRLRAYLQKEWLQQLLNEKLSDCSAANEWTNEDGGGAAIELPADLFENAADSVSNFEQKNVAGYYGKVRMGVVQTFFGEYLPTYSNDDGTRVTDGLKNDDEFDDDGDVSSEKKETEEEDVDMVEKRYLKFYVDFDPPFTTTRLARVTKRCTFSILIVKNSNQMLKKNNIYLNCIIFGHPSIQSFFVPSLFFTPHVFPVRRFPKTKSLIHHRLIRVLRQCTRLLQTLPVMFRILFR